MRMCIWCRKYKKKEIIAEQLPANGCVCHECKNTSRYMQLKKRKVLMKKEILDFLSSHGPASSNDLAAAIQHTTSYEIGGVAATMVKAGELARDLQPTHVWQWRLPAKSDFLPTPKIGRPKKIKTPDSTPTPAMPPDYLPPPLMPKNDKAIKTMISKLKNGGESAMTGITDEDLLWQVKYRAQAEWRKQRVANA